MKPQKLFTFTPPKPDPMPDQTAIQSELHEITREFYQSVREAQTEAAKKSLFEGYLQKAFANDLIKSFQPKGLFGARHVHTKILEVPLNAYSATNENHQKLAALGRQCTEKVRERYNSLTFINFENTYNVGRLRTEVRKSLNRELREIDGVLGRMLEGK